MKSFVNVHLMNLMQKTRRNQVSTNSVSQFPRLSINKDAFVFLSKWNVHVCVWMLSNLKILHRNSFVALLQNIFMKSSQFKQLQYSPFIFAKMFEMEFRFKNLHLCAFFDKFASAIRNQWNIRIKINFVRFLSVHEIERSYEPCS
jgi:hypothetical protein